MIRKKNFFSSVYGRSTANFTPPTPFSALCNRDRKKLWTLSTAWNSWTWTFPPKRKKKSKNPKRRTLFSDISNLFTIWSSAAVQFRTCGSGFVVAEYFAGTNSIFLDWFSSHGWKIVIPISKESIELLAHLCIHVYQGHNKAIHAAISCQQNGIISIQVGFVILELIFLGFVWDI